MDCSPKCRLAKHADFNFSALINITPHDEAKVRAILPRFCSNFARVKDQCGRNVLHLAASCGKRDILEWLVKEEGAVWILKIWNRVGLHCIAVCSTVILSVQ